MPTRHHSAVNAYHSVDVLFMLQVDSLAAIAAATSNEVTLQHLGSRFAAAAGSYILEGAETQSAAANPYDMPQF